MPAIKFLVNDRRFEELKSAIKYKGITLTEACEEIAKPYLDHCRSIKNEHENGPDVKLIKRMQKESKRAFKKELRDRNKEFHKEPNNIIPFSAS